VGGGLTRGPGGTPADQGVRPTYRMQTLGASHAKQYNKVPPSLCPFWFRTVTAAS
jgi:hypothetical protein